MKKTRISCEINEKSIELEVSDSVSIADTLHHTLGLTGTKVCCELGICKACTVVYTHSKSVEMQKTQACITPMIQMDGCKLTTIEGLEKTGF